MMGDGIGFVPEKGEIVAPFDGTVKTIFPTKHAIGLESDTGIEVLIHIGIDTVKLNGEGFESLVDVNEPVTQGQPLMKINLAYLKEHAPSVVTPVIITNQGDKTLTFDDVDSVDPGKRIMTLIIKQAWDIICVSGLFYVWQSMTELKRCCLKVFNSNPFAMAGRRIQKECCPLIFI